MKRTSRKRQTNNHTFSWLKRHPNYGGRLYNRLLRAAAKRELEKMQSDEISDTDEISAAEAAEVFESSPQSM